MSEEKLYPDQQEQRKLANELLVNSRGFLLIVVTAEGRLEFVTDTKYLNDAEILGMQTFSEDVVDGEYFDEDDEE